MNAPDAVSSQNIIINLAVFVGTVIGALITYRKTRKAESGSSTDDVVLAGASVADMRPVREMGADLKRLADAAEGIEKVLVARQQADEAEAEDELRDRIRDLERSLEDAGRAPPPRRRR